MASFDRKRVTLYRWWSDTIDSFSKKQLEMLEEEANNIINDLVKLGHTSGELNTTIVVHSSEVKVQGWWEMSTETL